LGLDENEFNSSFTPELKSANTEELMLEVSVRFDSMVLPDLFLDDPPTPPDVPVVVLFRLLFNTLFLLASSELTESDPEEPD
jgi:hypothetical protein